MTRMAQLTAFVFTSLNGFYKGPDEDISWHTHEEEEVGFSEEGLASESILVFGRKTYEHMAAFWPTPEAAAHLPTVAKGMNAAEKIAISRTPFTPTWEGTRCISGDVVGQMRELKENGAKDMTVLGSGEIVTLFADHGLIDTYLVMIDVVAIGEGSTLFGGITKPLNLDLVEHRVFRTGNVLLTLQPRP